MLYVARCDGGRFAAYPLSRWLSQARPSLTCAFPRLLHHHPSRSSRANQTKRGRARGHGDCHRPALTARAGRHGLVRCGFSPTWDLVTTPAGLVSLAAAVVAAVAVPRTAASSPPVAGDVVDGRRRPFTDYARRLQLAAGPAPPPLPLPALPGDLLPPPPPPQQQKQHPAGEASCGQDSVDAGLCACVRARSGAGKCGGAGCGRLLGARVLVTARVPVAARMLASG